MDRSRVFFLGRRPVRKPKKLGLSGWVRNLDDGTVETEFQGEKETVERLLEWLPQGSAMSHVTRVNRRETDPVSGESEFVITW